LKNKYYSKKEKKSDLNELSLDSSFIANKNGIEKIGRNKFYKNKNGIKVTSIVDSKGIPIELLLSKGNKHDARIVPKIISKLKMNKTKIKKYLLADKGYDSKKIREVTLKKKYEPIIPKRRYKSKVKKKQMGKKLKEIYKKRIIVEKFFSWIKMNPKIDKMYEKTIKSYEGLLKLACSILIYKRT
jgi:putative transposase